MKINSPGHQPPSVPPPGSDSEGADDKVSKRVSKRDGGPAPADAPSSGKAFAEKLVRTGSVVEPRATEAPAAAARSRATPVRDLAADLEAGRVSPRGAIEKVVERVVARQLGPDAPPETRERIRAALQDALETDPLLAEKLRGLD